VIGKGGQVSGVIWDGPAFKAGMTVAAEIIAVNNRVYSDEGIREAVREAKGGKDPIKLIVKSGKIVREVAVQWNGGLRYPKLEKIGAGEGSLDRLLKPLP
jgi:predicted metalloprotease with PDZ domain